MKANHASTAWACPLLFFFHEKLLCSRGFDSECILDQADLIPFSVPLIHSLDESAGKRLAFETKINPALDRAISYLASPAIGRLTLFRSSAAWTGSLLSEMCVTDRAIHPARRKHGDG
jgi:hypothetical protein